MKILALSASSDERSVREMLSAGAVGYLVKVEAPEAIVRAVQAVDQGGGWFSPSIAVLVARWSSARSVTSVELSERERAVLKMIIAAKTNKEISRALGLAERTVEFHVSNLFRKLQVASRTEAAVWARERGIVDDLGFGGRRGE